MSFSEIESLSEIGDYKKALSLIERMRYSGIKDDRLIVLHISCLKRSGKFDEAIDVIEEYLSTHPVTYEHLKIKLEKASCLWYLGKHETAEEVIVEIEESVTHILQNVSDSHDMKRRIFSLRGVISIMKGEMRIARDYFIQAINLFPEENPISVDYAFLLNNLGLTQIYLLNYYEASHSLKQAFKIFLLNNNRKDIAYVLNVMGILNHAIGKYQIAKSDFIRSLKFWKEQNKLIEVSGVLFELIRVLLKIGERKTALNYLGELESFSKTTPIGLIQQRYRVAEGLCIKSKSRLWERFMALNKFEQILQEKIFDAKLSIIALQHYSELLLTEFQITAENEVLDLALRSIDRLTEMSKKNYFHNSYVRSLILKSRLAFTGAEVEKAIHLLESAEDYAKSYGLKVILNEIELEKNNLQNRILFLSSGIEYSTSLIEKIKKIQILEYLKEIQKIIN